MPAQNYLDGLVGAMMESYRSFPAIANPDATAMPDRETVIMAIYRLRDLFFPGYFPERSEHDGPTERAVKNDLTWVCEKLGGEVAKALRRDDALEGDSGHNAAAQAESIIERFLMRLPDIRATLATDVEAALNGEPSARIRDEVISSDPGFFAICVNRVAHELHRLSVPLIPLMMSEYAHSVTGIDIHPGATICRRFSIKHGTGVVIGETAFIGNNVKIHQGVTIGSFAARRNRSPRFVKRHPTLKDDVTVYQGASILGGKTVIGKGVVIGCNAFITKSVPDKAKVSAKNPDLQFKDHAPLEFTQERFPGAAM